MKGHSDVIRVVLVSREGDMVVSGSDDCTLRRWSLSDASLQATFVGHTSPVTAAVLLGRFLFSGRYGFASGIAAHARHLFHACLFVCLPVDLVYVPVDVDGWCV